MAEVMRIMDTGRMTTMDTTKKNFAKISKSKTLQIPIL